MFLKSALTPNPLLYGAAARLSGSIRIRYTSTQNPHSIDGNFFS